MIRHCLNFKKSIILFLVYTVCRFISKYFRRLFIIRHCLSVRKKINRIDKKIFNLYSRFPPSSRLAVQEKEKNLIPFPSSLPQATCSSTSGGRPSGTARCRRSREPAEASCPAPPRPRPRRPPTTPGTSRPCPATSPPTECSTRRSARREDRAATTPSPVRLRRGGGREEGEGRHFESEVAVGF